MKQLLARKFADIGQAGVYALVGCWLIAMATTTPQATPFTWAFEGGSPKPPRWPPGSTINVYIDPNSPLGDLVSEGIHRWDAELASRGLTLNITVGAVPDPPPDNLVRVGYGEEGALIGKADENGARHQLGSGQDKDQGFGEVFRDPVVQNPNVDPRIIRGVITLLNSLPTSTDEEREFVRNLAMHEFTHVVGLADDSSGFVMDHEQQGYYEDSFNLYDLWELSTLYPVPPEPPPRALGETLLDPDANQFLWRFTYQGPTIGHVPLVVIPLDRRIRAREIRIPYGWVEVDPWNPQHLTFHYGYYFMYEEDGWPGSATLWDPGCTAPLAFRALTPDAALSATNPVVQFALLTADADRGLVPVWAGGDVQFLTGPLPRFPNWRTGRDYFPRDDVWSPRYAIFETPTRWASPQIGGD